MVVHQQNLGSSLRCLPRTSAAESLVCVTYIAYMVVVLSSEVILPYNEKGTPILTPKVHHIVCGLIIDKPKERKLVSYNVPDISLPYVLPTRPTIDVTIFSYSKYILESEIKSLRMFSFILLHEWQSHSEG